MKPDLFKWPVPSRGFGVQHIPFKPATTAPDVSNHVLPEHLHPEPDLRTFLERLTKTHLETMLELRAIRNGDMSRAVNTNMAYTARINMTQAAPRIFNMRTLFNGLPALNVSCLSLGLTGSLQIKTGDMGDADYVNVPSTGRIFWNEEIEEIAARPGTVGTGFAVLRFGAWQPPAGTT